MDNNKNISALPLGILLAAALLAMPVGYADITVDKVADLSFGTIDFNASPAVGNITMGTDGAITYGTTTSGAGTGTPGQILIGGTVGTTVSIACAPGVAANAAGDTLGITPVNIVVGAANVGPYAVGTECVDISTTIAMHTITATPAENTVFIGGVFAINGQPVTNATYRGSNLGGTQPSFRILVQ